MKKWFCLFVLFTISSLWSQPQPGDVFREYRWFKKDGDAGQSLRVGGREGTTNWNTSIVDGHWETVNIDFPFDVDLEHAIRAEINVEKILCHDGTRGLAIQWNDRDWIAIPEARTIPAPQWQYQHHIYPYVSIPLQDIQPGKTNRFKMRVSTEHTWNWPQNLIYGMHLLIYYDQNKSHPTGTLTGIQSGDRIGRTVEFGVEASSPNSEISRVDFIGKYEDVNFEGDGVYRQWHYHFFHGEIMHHLGSALSSPWQIRWNTEWVPDQQEPMQLAARIIDKTGLIYFTKAITDLALDRPGLSVELCKPYDIPQLWVTRKNEFTQKINIQGDLNFATAYQLVWASWSPGYMNGVYVNDSRVFDKEGPNYAYYAHRITLEDVSVLKAGENLIKTGKTPKINGKMVHGMEVEYPGIMVLVKYEQTSKTDAGKPDKDREFDLIGNYPNPFNPQTTISYSVTKANEVRLDIYDLAGRLVCTPIDEFLPAGKYETIWPGRDDAGRRVASGVYLCDFSLGDQKLYNKMLLMR